jgi:hypothetical protein
VLQECYKSVTRVLVNAPSSNEGKILGVSRGRRQEAGGKRQEARGKRQKARGKRQRA